MEYDIIVLKYWITRINFTNLIYYKKTRIGFAIRFKRRRYMSSLKTTESREPEPSRILLQRYQVTCGRQNYNIAARSTRDTLPCLKTIRNFLFNISQAA